MERRFNEAVKSGEVEAVMEILMKNPDLVVNSDQGDYGWTALHVASQSGPDSIVSILLAHPAIDVNRKLYGGYTPYYIACANESASCVRLLKDSRVKVNEPDNGGYTPLRLAAYRGHLDGHVVDCLWKGDGSRGTRVRQYGCHLGGKKPNEIFLGEQERLFDEREALFRSGDPAGEIQE